MQDRHRTVFPPDLRARLISRGGTALRVQELLNLAKIPAERCHWYYRDRLVLVRVDPDRMEEALPNLALAVGGRYDAKSRRI